jgi:hypothetical protein
MSFVVKALPRQLVGDVGVESRLLVPAETEKRGYSFIPHPSELEMLEALMW